MFFAPFNAAIIIARAPREIKSFRHNFKRRHKMRSLVFFGAVISALYLIAYPSYSACTPSVFAHRHSAFTKKRASINRMRITPLTQIVASALDGGGGENSGRVIKALSANRIAVKGKGKLGTAENKSLSANKRHIRK